MSPEAQYFEFKKFDPLNSKYEIIPFGDIPVGKRFRYQKVWREKHSTIMGVDDAPGIGKLYYPIPLGKFVFVFKDEPLKTYFPIMEEKDRRDKENFVKNLQKLRKNY